MSKNTIYRAGAAVVSTITCDILIFKIKTFCCQVSDSFRCSVSWPFCCQSMLKL